MRFSRLAVAAVSAAVTSTFALTSAFASTVTVKPGDTLWKISHRNHLSLHALQAANPSVNPSRLKPGMTLELPGRSRSTSTYVVKPHDTVWKIAHRTGTTVQRILSANPRVNPHNLIVGTVLHMPSGSTTTTFRTTSTVTRTKRTNAVAVTSSVSEQNLYWMEHIIHAEADGQPFEAQVGVGDVVMHRLQSGQCGHTVKDVVFQISNGHYQFTPVENGYINTNPTSTNVQAAIAVLEQGEDVVPGAFVFYNPTETSSSSWVRKQPTVKSIGSFVFAK